MFKNLTIFRINAMPDMEALEDALSSIPFVPTSPTQKVRAGWVAPMGKETEALSHTVSRRTLMAMMVQTRAVPAQVLKDAFVIALKDKEEKENRTLSNRDKKELREDVELVLLPRAFPKNKLVNLWIDEPNGWLIVDTPTISVAEDACMLLRKSIGALAVEPIDDGSRGVVTSMSTWLDDREAPGSFQLGYDCTFKDEHSTSATFKKAVITLDEIVEVKSRGGMYVAEVELLFKDQSTFKLNEHLQLKSFTLTDFTKAEFAELDCQTQAEYIDAEFVLYSGEVEVVLAELLEVL